MSKKDAWDPRDTSYDEYHRKNGMMTNKEFFNGAGPGTFNEGMEWNGSEWVPVAAARQKEWEREQTRKANECPGGCGFSANNCHCW